MQALEEGKEELMVAKAEYKVVRKEVRLDFEWFVHIFNFVTNLFACFVFEG